MKKYRFLRHMPLLLGAVLLFWGITQVILAQKNKPGKMGQMRTTTQAERKAARIRKGPQKKGVSLKFAGVNPATAKLSPLATGAPALATLAAPLAEPDYFGVANYANSPLPVISSTGAITGGIRKFVDTLPGICGVSPWGSAGTNELGQCIPLAQADTTTFPGSDFYKIGLEEYSRQLHSDLPATNLRGYYDANVAPVHQYLGPLILATRNRPVRVLFQQQHRERPQHPDGHHLHGSGDR